MPRRDTVDKIVGSYFAAITTRPFRYGDTLVEPAPLRVGPNLLRGFTCYPNCGGCCPTFSLDYLPDEERPYDMPRREVSFDGRTVVLYSDMQDDNRGPRCRNLDHDTGLCGVHGKQPFSCDFELIRFMPHKGGWTVSERLFSRGWAMKRTDGGVGALCTVDEATVDTALDVARRLERLVRWADHFGLSHRARTLVDYCRLYADMPDQAPTVVLR